MQLQSICEGDGDVVGVVTPLRGVAQVVLHGIQVVKVGVRHRVHQDIGVQEDGEGQVEVEREESEVKSTHTCMTMEWCGTQEHLEPMTCVWHRHQERPRLRALRARVVVCVLVLVDVVCVMIVVLITHVDLVAIYSVFVAIFFSWRCTLYISRRWRWTALTVTEMITVIFAPNSLWDSCHT